MQYLNELNPVQKEAVVNTIGPVMVIAGAGSGKTRVLTYRIAHLIKSGVDPFNILSLTFTNKAAREMKERIMKIVGDTDAKNIWMGTFHSVFAKILRIESEFIGFPREFSIYDTSDTKKLIKKIISELNLDDKIYSANTVLGRISNAKSYLINWERYCQDEQIQTDDRLSKKPMIGKIYETYSKRLYKAGAMDFDDLLYFTYKLLSENPDALYKYQNKFQYILVDEYQDTNYAQYLILKLLAARFENICVVGDDAQSIYAFRGANIQNILNFQSDYPDSKVFKLEQNYRSTKTIVKAANSVIAKNQNQIQKDVWTDNVEGMRIKVSKHMSENEEGNAVARQIYDLIATEQMSYKDFAVLYRTNAQSRALEEALRRINIPYRIYGGLSFYQRKEIKDLLAYFRMAINPNDEEALLRIINYPMRGIGQTTEEKLLAISNDLNTSIAYVIENINNLNTDIHGGTRKKLTDFWNSIKSFKAVAATQDAFNAAQYIANGCGILKELLADETIEGKSRYENVEELLNGIKDFLDAQEELAEEEKPDKSLARFMQDISLLTGDDKKDDGNDDKVSLMTIHSAKGLEFPAIFIVGMEENLFPGQMALNNRSELEEERRLFYVALTRAEKKLFLSYAQTRYKWGNLTSCEASRFIDEIAPEFLELPAAQKPMMPKMNTESNWSPFKKNEPLNVNLNFPSKKLTKIDFNKPTSNTPQEFIPSNDSDYASGADIHAGMQVEHQRFGRGKVLSTEGVGADKKITIFFDTQGQKQLLVKFAKLKIIK